MRTTRLVLVSLVLVSGLLALIFGTSVWTTLTTREVERIPHRCLAEFFARTYFQDYSTRPDTVTCRYRVHRWQDKYERPMRHGSYEEYAFGERITAGQYRRGEVVGVWSFWADGELIGQIDFDQKPPETATDTPWLEDVRVKL